MVIYLGYPSPGTRAYPRLTVAGVSVWVTPRRLLALPDWGCRATTVTGGAVGSTPPFHPYPPLRGRGGLFSGPVRLAAPRRYLAVTDELTFERRTLGHHLSGPGRKQPSVGCRAPGHTGPGSDPGDQAGFRNEPLGQQPIGASSGTDDLGPPIAVQATSGQKDHPIRPDPTHAPGRTRLRAPPTACQ